ncbi:MAG: hypothetical protein GXP40_12555 [Chloroflexi bacterium]|nr:hypothetical protein [Chloroflexota bacterium]
MKSRQSISWVLLLALAASLFSPAFMGQAVVRAQTATPPPNVLTAMENMTPEERVGQLFLVTFNGTDIGPDSQIYDLITNYHVGGVVLLAENDNFTAAPNTVADAYQLISDLQKAEWNSSLIALVDPATGEQHWRTYVPLFIGISQESGYPYEQILNGLTPLPNPMSIGATWQPELATQTGAVLGRELSALGFNLYLGPSLDVLEAPRPTGSGDLGTRAFGGDPYWVGEMGRAFISGLHSGSEGKLLVVSKHFPGRGGSDRLPEEEVATVRKSLEQLKQIELAPFFAVTGNAPTELETTDGLLVSHIRYQGFQGNIRATTRPVSFDAQALTQILELPPFSEWRANGGLMFSDDLGSRAVHEFYAPGAKTFSARLVARDAFLAGNDLLYLGNILSTDSPDTYDTVLKTLDFFAQKYREDPAFAQRVDDAVVRILTLKSRLYPYFSLGAVRPPAAGLDLLGQSEQAAFDVAQQAATLISPELKDLDAVLPAPPGPRDRLVFITDIQTVSQCSTCPAQVALDVTTLQDAVLRLYGPDAGGQTRAENLFSYSFSDLAYMLDNDEFSILESDLRRAEWVILSLVDTDQGQIQTIRRFLSEQQNLLRDKRVILLSFTAPYYLDATDISKLTAYYGLYSQAPPFVDVAARLLYQELTPVGALPVSVLGIGYDLITATTPDPAQLITLSLDLPIEPAPTAQATTTPEPTPEPLFSIGDTIAVRTGVIVDHNGHPVPDGTVVYFSLVVNGESGGVHQKIDTETVGGVARASIRLDKTGLLDIRATSDPAIVSETLRLDVTAGEGAAVTVIPPVPTGTTSPTPAAAQTPDGAPDIYLTPDGYPRVGAWLLMALLLALGTSLAYWAGGRLRSMRWGLRWALCVLLGGLLAYNYLALGLPGSNTWMRASGLYGVVGFTVLGEMLGWGVAWLWSRRASDSMSQSG